jgi:hypothetical protein
MLDEGVFVNPNGALTTGFRWREDDDKAGYQYGNTRKLYAGAGYRFRSVHRPLLAGGGLLAARAGGQAVCGCDAYRCGPVDGNEDRGDQIGAFGKKAYHRLAQLFPQPLDADENVRNAALGHIRKVIIAAKKLDIRCIDTFIGKDHRLTVSENMELFKKYWRI